MGTQNSTSTSTRDREGRTLLAIKKSKARTAVERMCGLSTVVTPAGASLTMYREIRSYANSIWDDNNNNNNRVPPGPHSRDVSSCPREREGGYKPIPPDLPGGYRPPGRLLLQLQRLSSVAGFRLTPKGMYVCM